MTHLSEEDRKTLKALLKRITPDRVYTSMPYNAKVNLPSSKRCFQKRRENPVAYEMQKWKKRVVLHECDQDAEELMNLLIQKNILVRPTSIDNKKELYDIIAADFHDGMSIRKMMKKYNMDNMRISNVVGGVN